MYQHLLKTGNSVVLSLPEEILDGLGIKEGDHVDLEFDRAQRRVIITPVEKLPVVAGVDEEFARQVSEFIRQYRPALEELAR